MEQLIRFHKNKLNNDCQCKIDKEEMLRSENVQKLQQVCNENKLYIEKCIHDTYNELKTKYKQIM